MVSTGRDGIHIFCSTGRGGACNFSRRDGTSYNFFHDRKGRYFFFFDGTGGTFLFSQRDGTVRIFLQCCTGERNEEYAALGTKSAAFLSHHLLSSPFRSLSLLVANQIRGHIAGASPPCPLRFVPCTFIAIIFQLFLPSSTRV